jgi:hypothetical protein
VGLGMKSVAADLGIELHIKLFTDSVAAKGIVTRKGLGKLRHIEVGYLWLQDVAAEKRVQIYKVCGEDNPADLGTKHLSGEVISKHLTTLGYHFEDGRSTVVPAS